MSTNPQKIVKQEQFQCSRLLIINHRNSLFSMVSTLCRWVHEGYVTDGNYPVRKETDQRTCESELTALNRKRSNHPPARGEVGSMKAFDESA